MDIRKASILKSWLAAAAVVAVAVGTAQAQDKPLPDASVPSTPSQAHGEALLRQLNDGQPQPALEQPREEFPFLADAIAGYALGEVWGRDVLDPRTRQLVAVSAFAAQGNLAYLKIHAGYALNLGVGEDALKEVVYLTTVHAGFPRAIDAANALKEVFAARRR